MKPGILNWRVFGMVACVLLACESEAVLVQSLTTRSAQIASQQNGSGDSTCPIITPDGRYVVFASAAGNLVTNNAGFVPARMDVYVRDRVSQQTTLVSVNVNGNGGGDADSIPTDISSDGRYVVFESGAKNLVSGDTNGCNDIFVRDLVAGTTALVSVGSAGGFGNGSSTMPVMTPDGRYVAFVSSANNLVSNDTNGIADIFVRDMQLSVTTLASPGATSIGSLQASASPTITPDGRYVAFFSWAKNVVSGLTNQGEIYLRDLVNGQTYLASTNAHVIASQVFGAVDVASFDYAISDDGQYVVYEISPKTTRKATVVVRGQPFTGITDVISTNGVPSYSFENARSVDISPGGRFVTFIADTTGGFGTQGAVYLWDGQSNSTTLVSADLSGNFSPGVCDWPVIDPTGRYVTFFSMATNLTGNAPTGWGLYVRDVVGGVTALVEPSGTAVTPLTCATVSSNGQFIAFDSAGLVADSTQSDVFVRDLVSGGTELISTHDASLPEVAANAASAIGSSCITGNGRYLTFSSKAEDLVTNDTNGFRDIFVQDRVAGLTVLASANTNGTSGNGPSYESSISADGRYVAFTSAASDLMAGDTNNVADVFVRDMASGTVALVSINSDGITEGNKASYSPTISADGRKVLFHSLAQNLAPGLAGALVENLFIRDLQALTTRALTTNSAAVPAAMSPDGRYVAFPSSSSSMVYLYDTDSNSIARTFTFSSGTASWIGCCNTKVAFANTTQVIVGDIASGSSQTISNRLSNRPGLRFSGDGRYLVYANTNNVYMFDAQLGTNILVSQAFDGSAANDVSYSPDISADGRYVTFVSAASNLVANDTNGVPDVFLYDAVLGTMSIVGSSRSTGGSADGRSMTPFFSPDGQTLVFESWGNDVVAQDYNDAGDLLALDVASVAPVYPGDPVMSFVPTSFTFFGTSAADLTLSWQVDPTRTYQVQFKNDLNEPTWQNLQGNMVFIGNVAYAQDLAGQTQRFYRVVVSN